MAVAMRAMARRSGVRGPPSVIRRSSQVVSNRPAATSGCSRRAARKDLLVIPPRMTIVVSRRARSTLARASARVRPYPTILAIMESNSAGITSPWASPVSIRTPGPDAHTRRSTVPGDGAKSRSGILGVEPDLDGMPPRRRRLSLEAAAAGDVQLQLDQVDACRDLCDGVLDLEAGVDLQECQQVLLGPVEEFHGGRAPVARDLGQRHRRGPGAVLGLRAEDSGGRLLDQLLISALDRAVPHPHGPNPALAVGDDLHLHMPAPDDHPLQEEGVVAEAGGRLAPGALPRCLQAAGIVDPPDATAPASRGGLYHQGIADGLAVAARLVEGGDRAPTPRRDGYPGVLGEALGADLVPEAAHDIPARADEGQAHPCHQIGK